ncbi:Protein of unknown function [Propionibacterium freudenreichii]|nr:Protein of unknown function [Propionibacterium freudenreichii]
MGLRQHPEHADEQRPATQQGRRQRDEPQQSGRDPQFAEVG